MILKCISLKWWLSSSSPVYSQFTGEQLWSKATWGRQTRVFVLLGWKSFQPHCHMEPSRAEAGCGGVSAGERQRESLIHQCHVHTARTAHPRTAEEKPSGAALEEAPDKRFRHIPVYRESERWWRLQASHAQCYRCVWLYEYCYIPVSRNCLYCKDAAHMLIYI